LIEPDTLDKIYVLATKDEEKKPEEKKKPLRTAKAAIVKRIADKILEKKLSAWLETLDLALLNAIATAIELENAAKAKKELVPQVLGSVLELGAEDLFALLDTPLLRAACKEGGLDVTDEHTKAQLVTALATGTVEKAEKKEKKAPEKPSEKKPEIAKGISAVDLHTHYYVTDIHKYCVDHGLKTSGNKKDMIKRILASFEGDKTVEKGYKKEKKPKRKQPEAGKKEKPATKKAKKEPAAAAPAPAPAPAPKKPEAAPAAKKETKRRGK